MLKVGSTAPDFSLSDHEEKIHNLHDYKGQWILLYFYPKDDTPGCTTETCGLRDVWKELQKQNCTVLGVSKDSSKSHDTFRTKYNVPFTLLSDESTEMIESYGAWQEKSMYGKKYMGIARISYLIDPEGNIAKVYPKVKPKEHAAEVLEGLEELVR